MIAVVLIRNMDHSQWDVVRSHHYPSAMSDVLLMMRCYSLRSMLSETSLIHTREGNHVTHDNLPQLVAATNDHSARYDTSIPRGSDDQAAQTVWAALAEFLVCVDVHGLLHSLDTDSRSDCESEGIRHRCP